MTSGVPDFDTANPCSSGDKACKATDPLRQTLYDTEEGYTPVQLMGVDWVRNGVDILSRRLVQERAI